VLQSERNRLWGREWSGIEVHSNNEVSACVCCWVGTELDHEVSVPWSDGLKFKCHKIYIILKVLL
jgi:hypothetical protein